MKIIVVDDDPVSLTVMKGIVAKLPRCTVVPFSDASAALACCLDAPPDLVIVDFMMPEIDGVAFSRRLRMGRLTYGVPIVMVSAALDETVLKSALHHGVDEFLHKPFTFIELQSCVSELLGLRAMQGQLASRELLRTARENDRVERHERPSVLGRHSSRARLGGDDRLLSRVARLVIEYVPGILVRIREGLLSSSFEAVVQDVVLLKGAVAGLDAPQLSRCLDRLELRARGCDARGATAAFAFAQTLAERLLVELTLVMRQPGEREADGPAAQTTLAID